MDLKVSDLFKQIGKTGDKRGVVRYVESNGVQAARHPAERKW